MCAGLFRAELHALHWEPKGLFTPVVLGRVIKSGLGSGKMGEGVMQPSVLYYWL